MQYIKEQMDAGFRKAQIYDALLRAGWYKEDIDAAFYEVVKRSSFAPEPQAQPAVSKQAQKPKKSRSRKKIAAALVLTAAAIMAAAALLGIFNPLDYIFPGGWISAPEGPSAEGFSRIGVLDWHYSYDGNFSVTFMNLAGVPITINSVSAECGQANPVVLETMEPTHLENGTNVTYSAGDEKCGLREPHESYSVAMTVRYISENNHVASSTGIVSGEVE